MVEVKNKMHKSDKFAQEEQNLLTNIRFILKHFKKGDCINVVK